MRSVGIDPAPAKGLHVFEAARERSYAVPEAGAVVSALAKDRNVLVCWDAPLTGPPARVVAGPAAMGYAFTKRPIEQFFSRAEYGFKVPAGISVLGYGSCPHWTISRHLVGLPRVGQYDRPENELPFALAWEPPQEGPCIVEVHPAVALWLWCAPKGRRATALAYKGRQNLAQMKKLWAIIEDGPWAEAGAPKVAAPANDDELDARVAFLLGALWLRKRGAVALLGDNDTGAFLLPVVNGLQDAWDHARLGPVE